MVKEMELETLTMVKNHEQKGERNWGFNTI